jgi:hypothetical protein
LAAVEAPGELALVLEKLVEDALPVKSFSTSRLLVVIDAFPLTTM